MNRKLKNCLIALSASGLALVAAILAGGPVVEHVRPTAAPLAGTAVDADDQEAYRPRVDRRGLALPYFSFARGVRRIGG
ncbi:hypothetical protein [Luteimonas arsenica]|uniref:hypothetical protein n=1 Tax=Luteimonas arsenica TaxID=1586242 RepID=UPI001055661A|nr:hypothetical protein [Luteimonas arsenica]